jgi:hypothetical protein
MADDSHVAIIDLPYAETRYCITERGRAALIQSEL